MIPSKIPAIKPKQIGNIVNSKLTGILPAKSSIIGWPTEIESETPRFPVNKSERYVKNSIIKGWSKPNNGTAASPRRYIKTKKLRKNPKNNSTIRSKNE